MTENSSATRGSQNNAVSEEYSLKLGTAYWCAYIGRYINNREARNQCANQGSHHKTTCINHGTCPQLCNERHMDTAALQANPTHETSRRCSSWTERQCRQAWHLQSQGSHRKRTCVNHGTCPQSCNERHVDTAVLQANPAHETSRCSLSWTERQCRQARHWQSQGSHRKMTCVNHGTCPWWCNERNMDTAVLQANPAHEMSRCSLSWTGRQCRQAWHSQSQKKL